MHNKHFDLAPVHYLRNWNVGIHLFVLFIILFFPLALWVKLGLSVCVGCSFLYIHYEQKNNPYKIVSFKCEKEIWKLYDIQNKQYRTQLSQYNYISDFLLILNFESDLKEKISVIIFRNQLLQKDWRYLHMIVRH